jgi:predicted DNA-binding protein (UPF0251 family)
VCHGYTPKLQTNIQLIFDFRFVSIEVFVTSLPVPSHIHYELLLQLLERQTLPTLHSEMNQPQIAAKMNISREHLQSAIINLRKAFALQKQVEDLCQYHGIQVSYRWSLTESEQEMGKSLKDLSRPKNKDPQEE